MFADTDAILRELKERGHKFTGKRQAIVEAFVDSEGRYLTAKDVFDVVRETYPNISFDTVYRTLTMLEENNVIEPLEFNDEAAKYRLRCEARHHHHLVCLKCGSAEVYEGCPMEALPSQANGFTITEHKFEMYGYCATCTRRT